MADSSDDAITRAVTRRGDRQFGDEEMRRILERATELQERSIGAIDSNRGLTLEELRQVAIEAGIDSRFVDLAAAESVTPLESGGSGLIGSPERWHVRTSIPGEIDDRAREEILVALRAVTGAKGTIEYVFGRMEWHHDDTLGPIVIGVTSRDGMTEIDLSCRRNGEVGLMFGLGLPFGGVVGGLGLTAAVGLGGAAAFPFIGLASVGSWAITRAWWAHRSKEWERKLGELVERVTEIVRNRATLATPDSLALPASPETGDGSSAGVGPGARPSGLPQEPA